MTRQRIGSSFILATAATMAVSFGLSGCASMHRAAKSIVSSTTSSEVFDHASGAAPKEAPEAYRTAVYDLELPQYEKALDGLETFLRQNPTSPWTQAASLNAGRALEGLERWTDASERYRSVVQATQASGHAPKLQAMALYRLSVCSEAVGDDAQVVVALNDLLKRTQFLPAEVATAELPARLAGAYARVGNFERSQEFYRRAEAGVSRLRQEAGGAAPEWLPRTLFQMGESSRRQLSWNDFEVSIRPLARGQVYLLQSAEIGQSPWSDRAADDLISVYDSLFEIIQTAPLPAGDPVAAKRKLQIKQVQRAGVLIDLVSELRARSLPEAQSSPQALKIQTYLTKLDKRIQNLLLERPAGEGLTAEGKARASGRAEKLKVIEPDTTIEQQFLKSSRETLPTKAQVPAPAPEQVPVSQPVSEPPPTIRVNPPSPEDPNL